MNNKANNKTNNKITSAANMTAWMSLAAAVVKSGEKTNDVKFLESDWYKELKGFVQEYVQNDDIKKMPVTIALGG